MEKRRKSAIESGVLIVVVAGILVALNALSALGMYKKIDTTKTEKYTLSKGSGNLLATMKQKVRIDAYVTKGLPKLDAYVSDLRDLLVEYKQGAKGNFDFAIIEAKEDEDKKKEAKSAGLVEMQFLDVSNTAETLGATKGYMGLVLNYGTEQDKIPSLIDPRNPEYRADGLEFWITNKLREMRDKGDGTKHEVGVLTGHDEIKLSDPNLMPAQRGGPAPSARSIVEQAFPFYHFVDVDLKGGDANVPENLDGLIITQPGKDLTEKELKKIDEFVMKGKSLVVIAGAVNTRGGDAQMNATLNTHGLEKLVGGYGMELQKDMILDMGGAFTLGVPVAGGRADIPFYQFLLVRDDPRFTGDEQLLDTAFPGFFRMQMVTMPFASSINILQDKQPDAKIAVHARSTPRAGHLVQDSISLSPFESNGTLRKWPRPKEWRQYNLAASIEGTISSAYPEADKPAAKSASSARVLLIASPQYLANPIWRAAAPPEMPGQQHQMQMPPDEQLGQLAYPYLEAGFMRTILSFKNVLDWMSGDTDLLAASAKLLTDPNLVYGDVTKPGDLDETEEAFIKRQAEEKKSRKTTQVKVEVALIVGIPLLIALLGVARWRLRIRSRANVSLA